MDLFEEAGLNEGFGLKKTELIDAVLIGDDHRVAELLDAGADVEECDWMGATPLIVAAHTDLALSRDFPPFDALLKMDKDAVQDFQARMEALSNRDPVEPPVENLPALNLLLSRGADLEARDKSGMTALASAAQGFTESTRVLLE